MISIKGRTLSHFTTDFQPMQFSLKQFNLFQNFSYSKDESREYYHYEEKTEVTGTIFNVI